MNGCTNKGCAASGDHTARADIIPVLSLSLALMALAPSLRAVADTNRLDVVNAARAQIGRTIAYDPTYRPLDFPNGDVPIEVGVCTDVVIRAARSSLGIDLQKQVHEDMKGHFAEYPKNWGLKKPDKNIDHRRVPNLQTYFRRIGWEIPVTRKAGDYRPGDLVTCLVPPRLPHIMIVSDRVGPGGQPLVIHNIGSGTKEEDRLFEFEITGHYRLGKGVVSAPAPSGQSGR